MHWRVTAPKDHIIFDEGDASEAIYCIESGCVRLQINDEDGRRHIFAFLFPGDIFGMALDGRRAASAEAVVASELTRYPLSSMPLLMAQGPQALADLLNAASRLVSNLSHHLAIVTHAPAEERLMTFLTWMAERRSERDVLNLPMSRRDIADFLALAPETLSRTFSKLEAQGLFNCEGRHRIRFARPPRRGQVVPRGLERPAA